MGKAAQGGPGLFSVIAANWCNIVDSESPPPVTSFVVTGGGGGRRTTLSNPPPPDDGHVKGLSFEPNLMWYSSIT